MKGYTVDVRGFSVDKKQLVVEAIDSLIGAYTIVSDRAMNLVEVFTSVDADGYTHYGAHGNMYRIMNDLQLEYEISFNDLMLEAGFNYVEDGVEGFKAKPSNKTRPLITREQYDLVMAQSDKRTFTKALDDLLAIEKEQLLDESAIRISQLEKDNAFLSKAFESWRESHEKLHYSKLEVEAKLEKHKRISGVLSLLLISSVAAQLAVIFLGG